VHEQKTRVFLGDWNENSWWLEWRLHLVNASIGRSVENPFRYVLSVKWVGVQVAYLFSAFFFFSTLDIE